MSKLCPNEIRKLRQLISELSVKLSKQVDQSTFFMSLEKKRRIILGLDLLIQNQVNKDEVLSDENQTYIEEVMHFKMLLTKSL